MSNTKKIYFASPLFDEASRQWNNNVVSEIRNNFEDKVSVYLPQENDSINDKSDTTASVTSQDIYNADIEQLVSSDILIANLDCGLEVDSGVACEIGYFAHLCELNKDKKIIGLISDVRWNAKNGAVGEQHGVYKNLFVVGAVKEKGVLVTCENGKTVAENLVKVLNTVL